MAEIFAHHFIPILKKRTLTNLTKTWANFLLIPFLNIKKNNTWKSLQNQAQLLADPLFKY